MSKCQIYIRIHCYYYYKIRSIRFAEYDPLEFILGETSLQSNPFLNDVIRTSEAHSSLKQTYSRLSTMYCMINDYYNGSAFLHSKSINLETLSLKWMDPSYEIREAAQALLKSELKRIGPQGRASLVKTWEIHLMSLLKEFDDLNQLSVQQSTLVSGQHHQSMSSGLYTLK